MKAVRVNQWCGPRDLTIEQIANPEPTENEVLIKVESAALNFPDLLLIAGKYQVKPELPFTPGLEVAGTVEQAGPGATSVKPGQQVMAQLASGGLAEYVVAPVTSVTAMPRGMTFDEAAGFPLVYQTSYFGLAYRAALRKGETVLVHSAAGGVGLAAVQIARALGAGKVIGTAGADSKLDLIREQGADVALNYQTEDFVDVVKRETKGRGADVIYDPVGGEVGERSTKCIAFEGRLLIIGFTSGKFSNFVSNHILIKNYSIVGLHWGSYRHHNPALIEQAWKELTALYEDGKLKPVVGARYQMDSVAEAMEHLGSRQAVGKVVLHW
ncbi:MAG TPA: NADPH:quinone oxidoreductase family protein [Blastocatellia bacterium]|nr:NADPH:quinone oxidoreductase family protein [Blastocatellia bacterium]